MRSSELAKLEEERAARRAESPTIVRRDLKPEKVGKGWDPRTIKDEVRGEFRSHGAKVFREEKA